MYRKNIFFPGRPLFLPPAFIVDTGPRSGRMEWTLAKLAEKKRTEDGESNGNDAPVLHIAPEIRSPPL
uniref:Uncharacterized protein n=1 Tax=Candidatus Kentrum sp. SD TaxID=2126332 RepID=A0A451BIF2_9GAMM|nr:MAG: hypothetical protein BECKSD772F_GA0070984_10034 [Candidatus Kentron sp. SD]VFK39643.1 MAG: hypothetical protein BECKSD772E_GA0070983_100368 [Candidatus Kentron sp. SD]VFK78049.1 MAG: hypothetical protein BECKSD772D_GA0070982_10064 [Candidatus Kentron sp. SD]